MKVNIPNPCTEKYDNMSPTELGRLCKVCNTEVVDFTNWETKDIVEYIQNSNQKVCGRLPQVKKTTYINWISIGASILLISSWNNLKALDIKNSELTPKPFLKYINKSKSLTDSILVQFIDEEKEIIPFVKFKNIFTGKDYQADKNGLIKLKVDNSNYLVNHDSFDNRRFVIMVPFDNSILKIKLKSTKYYSIGVVSQIVDEKDFLDEKRVKTTLKHRIKRLLNTFSIRDDN